jgi:hypothetical protein
MRWGVYQLVFAPMVGGFTNAGVGESTNAGGATGKKKEKIWRCVAPAMTAETPCPATSFLPRNQFPLPAWGGGLGWGAAALASWPFLDLGAVPPPTLPSPLAGEGWGEGATAVNLNAKHRFERRSPSPSAPLPRGERGAGKRAAGNDG